MFNQFKIINYHHHNNNKTIRQRPKSSTILNSRYKPHDQITCGNAKTARISKHASNTNNRASSTPPSKNKQQSQKSKTPNPSNSKSSNNKKLIKAYLSPAYDRKVLHKNQKIPSSFPFHKKKPNTYFQKNRNYSDHILIYISVIQRDKNQCFKELHLYQNDKMQKN